MHCVILIQPSGGGGGGGGGGEHHLGGKLQRAAACFSNPPDKGVVLLLYKRIFNFFFFIVYCWRLLGASFFLFQQSPGQRRNPGHIQKHLFIYVFLCFMFYFWRQLRASFFFCYLLQPVLHVLVVAPHERPAYLDILLPTDLCKEEDTSSCEEECQSGFQGI